MKDSLECIEDCLWEICVQNQYSAAKDYDEILNSKADSLEFPHPIAETHQSSGIHPYSARNDAEKADEKTKADNINVQYQLHRAAINEVRINEKLMAMKVLTHSLTHPLTLSLTLSQSGKPVLYGEPIQLRHYKSRKYLDVARNILAKNEKENMKVSLSTYGTILSHLCFAPKSKYDKEGSVVKQRDEMNLKVTLTHSLTYLLTHSLTYLLTYLLTHLRFFLRTFRLLRELVSTCIPPRSRRPAI